MYSTLFIVTCLIAFGSPALAQGSVSPPCPVGAKSVGSVPQMTPSQRDRRRSGRKTKQPFEGPFPNNTLPGGLPKQQIPSQQPLQQLPTQLPPQQLPKEQPPTQQPAQQLPQQQPQQLPGSSNQDTSDESIAKRFVDAHNMYRRRHGAPDVQWSEEMAKRAQAHANTCVLGHQDEGTTVPIGQNLMFSSRGSPEIAVKAWYDEISNYDFNTSQCTRGMCGHFTQVVWAASDKIGCAIANCGGQSRFRMSAVYVVCDYNPQGNVMSGSYYANNVKPPVTQ